MEGSYKCGSWSLKKREASQVPLLPQARISVWYSSLRWEIDRLKSRSDQSPHPPPPPARSSRTCHERASNSNMRSLLSLQILRRITEKTIKHLPIAFVQDIILMKIPVVWNFFRDVQAAAFQKKFGKQMISGFLMGWSRWAKRRPMDALFFLEDYQRSTVCYLYKSQLKSLTFLGMDKFPTS